MKEECDEPHKKNDLIASKEKRHTTYQVVWRFMGAIGSLPGFFSSLDLVNHSVDFSQVGLDGLSICESLFEHCIEGGFLFRSQCG